MNIDIDDYIGDYDPGGRLLFTDVVSKDRWQPDRSIVEGFVGFSYGLYDGRN